MSALDSGAKPFEQILDRQERLLATILRSTYDEPGVTFVTPGELSQQLAYLHHPAGRVIPPHVHNRVPRQIHFTNEVLLVRRGSVRVDFYDSDRKYLQSSILRTGDTILLVEGGHGFECLEDTIMIEVKQGPYAGEHDKTRFDGIATTKIKYTNAGS